MAQFTDPDVIRIREKIDQLGLKKKAVAEQAGIHYVYFSYIINGTRPLTESVKEKVFKILDLQ